MLPTVVAAHAGRPREERLGARTVTTAIRKAACHGPVRVDLAGLEGDRPADADHAGAYHAVYAFAAEDLALWSARLGRDVPPGLFGENLTTRGLDVNAALVGERWRVGEVLLEVVGVRIPCSTFQGWMASSGYDATAWVKRFAADGRPGPYLRVLEPGVFEVGDRIYVERRPDHDVTVSTMFRALTTERSLLPRLLELGDIDPDAWDVAVRHAAAPA